MIAGAFQPAMSRPLASAVSHFEAGGMSKGHMKYPKLARVVEPAPPKLKLPSLSSTGHKAPATKLPMGYTMPIMCKPHGNALDA
jgi:hypothetical protein